MKNLLKTSAIAAVISSPLAGCGYFSDEVHAPSQERLHNARTRMEARDVLRDGIFHMQRVSSASPVLMDDKVRLRRPDLPPFDVAYVNRDLESVVMELANAAGESVVIPAGLKGRKVSLIHSGANFQEMLDLVLAKTGYHYNYTDEVFHITRNPVRNYVLEVGQSSRKGSLRGDMEIDPISGRRGGNKLDTDYADAIWSDVRNALQSMIGAGSCGAASTGECAGKSWFRITESAGMVTVAAAPEAHRLIESYLEEVQASALRQVMVEAQIVALIRDKRTDRGVGVTAESNPRDSVLGTVGFQALDTLATQPGNLFGSFATYTHSSGNFTAALQQLSTIGDVYTISNPNILARNNQISRVSVTRQLGYAETEIDQNTTSAGDIVVGTRLDRPRFKNAGTVMSVMPYVGKSQVQMRFRLSVATKSGETEIRTAVGNDDAIINAVPELSNNVIDQDMVLEYGRVYAIGGLVEESTTVNETYDPILKGIPILQELLRRANNNKQDTEFIVLLKVTRG